MNKQEKTKMYRIISDWFLDNQFKVLNSIILLDLHKKLKVLE